jgi:hypothetical protein
MAAYIVVPKSGLEMSVSDICDGNHIPLTASYHKSIAG